MHSVVPYPNLNLHIKYRPIIIAVTQNQSLDPQREVSMHKDLKVILFFY